MFRIEHTRLANFSMICVGLYGPVIRLARDTHRSAVLMHGLLAISTLAQAGCFGAMAHERRVIVSMGWIPYRTERRDLGWLNQSFACKALTAKAFCHMEVFLFGFNAVLLV